MSLTQAVVRGERRNRCAKIFTNGKDDKPLVKRLYEDAFEEQFGKATMLSYSNLGWGNAEAAQLAEVLGSGAAPQLKKVVLQLNEIGDEGCKALAAALKEGAAPRLVMLELDKNKIGDEGCKALAAALGKEGGRRRGSRRSLSAATRLATRAARRWPPPSRREPPRA